MISHDTAIAISFLAAVVVGSVSILAPIYVYVKHHKSNIASAIFLLFGFMLIGLSVWSTITVDIDKDGAIKAKMESINEAIGDKTATLRQEVKSVQVQVAALASEVEKLVLASDSSAANSSANPELSIGSVDWSKALCENSELNPWLVAFPEYCSENRGVSVLIFNEGNYSDSANSIVDGFETMGFKSSATPVLIPETMNPNGGLDWWAPTRPMDTFTAKNDVVFVEYKKGLERYLPQIKDVLDKKIPDGNIEFKAVDEKMITGDFQIQLRDHAS